MSNESENANTSMEELGRIELPVGATNGYLLVNDQRMPLPIGSTLRGGRFYWQPGPGFLGEYDLVFERSDATPVRVRVVIHPKSYLPARLRTVGSPSARCVELIKKRCERIGKAGRRGNSSSYREIIAPTSF